MKKVLVTGASGFVGRHTLEPLKQRGFEVHGVASTTSAFAQNGVTWHYGNLLDNSFVRAVFEKVRPTHLLNLAWYIIPGNNDQSSDNFRWVQSWIECLLAMQDIGGGRAVSTGTCAEYDWSYGTLKESQTPLAAFSHYARSKKIMGEIHETIRESAGFSGAWARPFFVYGPHENPGRFVPSVIRALLKSEEALCTEGKHRRDYIHVQDTADALAAILDSDMQGAVNIGTGSAIALRDVAQRIAEIIGKPDLLRLGARPHIREEAPLVQADVTRLREELNWHPHYDIDSGLRDTIQWWSNHLD